MRRVILACLALLLVLPATAAAEQVPYRVDASNQAGWWRPLDELNGSLYVAYNAWGGPGPTNGGAGDTHTVYIGRKAPDGTWTRGCLKAGGGACAVYPDDIGHKQPSIAVDGDGYIHAFVAMHGDNWIYYRSAAPGDVTTMVNRSADLPDQGDQYTYPNLTRVDNGDVYLVIRAYPEGRLYRWDNAANRWTRTAVFARSPGYVAYPDDVAGDGNGNLHISWEWAYGGTNPLRHLGSYLRYDISTGRFHNAAGTVVTTPATVTSPVVYQPVEGTEDQTDRDDATRPPGVQSAKLALAGGKPVVAYRYRTVHGGRWHVRVAQWTGTAWQRSTVYAGAYDTHAAIDVTAWGGGLRVYYAKKATASGDQAFAASPSGSAWTETALLPGVDTQRLAVIRRAGTDHLYLTAPTDHQLHVRTFAW
ncbi:BNR-4 repeat-containing protein [Actinophytocola glycyrrhizae]|uniref:BNR-4 repeat-containing protein n=1 Tax=Actinophytocola glycyrrhizae TaxID=2044873 RepID=A0ABV9RVG3_9PSEU